MTEQEIDVLEKARFWILADADNHNSKSIKQEAKELADAIDDIIRKYQIPDSPDGIPGCQRDYYNDRH